jgi:hypothetical protein
MDRVQSWFFMCEKHGMVIDPLHNFNQIGKIKQKFTPPHIFLRMILLKKPTRGFVKDALITQKTTTSGTFVEIGPA